MSDAPGKSETDWSTQPVRRRRSSSGVVYGSWLPGTTLVLLGAIFLAQNYLGTTLRNWWALFILIPAFASLATGYEMWRHGDGEGAFGPIVGGLAFVGLTAVFLFDLPLGQLWPVFLIIAGVGLLLSRRGASWG